MIYLIFSSGWIDKSVIALRRQTNPNWKAFFFVTDDQFQFDEELNRFITQENDVRLRYLSIPPSHRPKVKNYRNSPVFTNFLVVHS